MSVGSFFGGLIIAAIGFVIVWKSDWLLNNMGRIDWADRHLGSEGGTRLMYKLIGIIIILAGFLQATNLGGVFIKWVITGIFGANIK